MGWSEFHEFCRRRGGVVGLTAAARSSGLPVTTVRDRARREGWWRPYPDVVGSPGLVVDGRALALAATLYARGGADSVAGELVATTRWTAWHLLGFQRSAPTRPQLVVPATRVPPGPRDGSVAPRSPRGVLAPEVVRSRGLQGSDVRIVQHVPTVTGARLVRDLAAVCELDRLRSAVIDLVHRRETDLPELKAALDRWPTFPGRPKVRRVLRELQAAGRTDSPLELLVRESFENARLPLDRGQVPVPSPGGVLHLDLGILAIRFAVEVDSFGHHSARTDLSRDAVRTNVVAATGEGWQVLRVTWDLFRGPGWDAFLDQARAVIRAQSQRHLGIDWPGPEHLRA